MLPNPKGSGALPDCRRWGWSLCAIALLMLLAQPTGAQVSDSRNSTDADSEEVSPVPTSGNSSRSATKQTSNYGDQAISISYEGEGLPVLGILNGTVLELDDIPSSIKLNKTKAFLNCSAGYMGISLEFERPFYGIVYADFDRNSACKISGRGLLTEQINLPLKGCGTLQNPVRVFTNNIVVRFHPGLEIDGDEVITIVCRYPPPIVPPPIIPVPLQVPPAEEIRTLAPLREFEILLIICAIVFLALLLLGIGCSYYCLKKRNIKMVKRRPVSTLGSEVTKISEPISMFGGLKIPRAHAEDTSGSEQLTESVRSEFGSELASTASEEEYTSAYSDAPFELHEGRVYPELHVPPRPGFDVRTKVKREERAFSPVSSKASSDSELILKAQEQYLTTILERTEVNTLETLERVRKAQQAALGPPPVHARVRVVNKAMVSDTSELESESEYSVAPTEVSDYYQDKVMLQSSDQTNFTLDVTNRQDLSGGGEYPSDQTTTEQIMRFRTVDGRRPRPQVDRMTHDASHFSSTNIIDETLLTSTSTTTNRHDLFETQDLITPVIVERATMNVQVGDKRRPIIPPAHLAKNNFDVLIRILDGPRLSPSHDTATSDDDASSVFTEEERFRLREVITTDMRIKKFLQESHTTEKILMLKDYGPLEKIVQPQKWDVLIRIIDHPDTYSVTKESIDSKLSLPRASTASSATNAQELRSLSEMSVDLANFRHKLPQEPDVRTTLSGYGGYSGVTSSYAQAYSVADRSGTEFTDEGHFVSREAAAHFINREAYFSSETFGPEHSS